MEYTITKEMTRDTILPLIPAKLIDDNYLSIMINDSDESDQYVLKIHVRQLLNEVITSKGYNLPLGNDTMLILGHVDGSVECTIESGTLQGITEGVQKLVMILEAPYAAVSGTNQATDYMRHATAAVDNIEQEEEKND